MKLIYIKSSIFLEKEKTAAQIQQALQDGKDWINHIYLNHKKYYFNYYKDFYDALIESFYIDSFIDSMYTIVIDDNNNVVIKNWIHVYNPFYNCLEYLDTLRIKTKIKKGEK